MTAVRILLQEYFSSLIPFPPKTLIISLALSLPLALSLSP